MIADTKKKRVLRFAAFLLLAAMLLTSCASAGKSTTVSQLQLGQKYLSEMNYSEAIAAFTEAIRLDPNDIQAYLGRAQAYEALEKYEEARDDYTAVIEKAGEMPYTQAQAYAGRAEINETLDEPVSAELDYSKALSLLEKDGTGDAENIGQETVTALLIRTLYRHAVVCIGLELRDKALADYDRLEQLGEDVSSDRDAMNDIPADTGADAEIPSGRAGCRGSHGQPGDHCGGRSKGKFRQRRTGGFFHQHIFQHLLVLESGGKTGFFGLSGTCGGAGNKLFYNEQRHGRWLYGWNAELH